MSDKRAVIKERVARAFLRGRWSYDKEAVIQRAVNERLLRLLERGPGRLRRVLEVGCCTGMLTEEIARRHTPELLFVNDLVPQFFDTVSERLSGLDQSRLRPCFGDIERCELPGDLDLVVSSSTLQWLDDLDAFFARIAAVLLPAGRLIFSMFGRETLGEVTELTGVGLDYPSFRQVRDALDRSFRIDHGEVLRDRLSFSEPRAVLRHIQATGVGGVGGYTWTPRRLEHFCQEYRRRFGDGQGVGLSYVSYLLSAEKRP
ncbi:MAG: methyltransferase domain-containing protein [Desulfofustis sp.]|nr:methyltransferase domain-containing protein [Desulfofustis sp.]